MDVGVEDGLWDELSHQQSREIAQHQRRHRHVASSSNSVTQAAQRMVGTAAEEIGRVAQVVYHAGSAAYQKSEQQRRYQAMQAASTERDMNPAPYLADFGIPKEEPLLQNQYHQTEYTGFDEERTQTAGNDFVFLPTFGSSGQGWGAVSNLDVFLASLYSYFYHRGLTPIVGKGIVELVTLFGTLVLSVFVSVYIDWGKLSTCIDESTCLPALGDYMVHRPFARWSLWNAVVILYVLLFLVYGWFAIWGFLHTVRAALDSRSFFQDRLGISARKLEGGVVQWETVVAKLLELQSTGEYRVAIHGEDLDALVISNRILRKENFMVALVNRGLLDVSVPFFANQTFFCSSLEWSIYFCVLNFMFNHKYQVRPAFYLDASALKRRFILCGVVHLVFMPFLLFFMTLHFGLQNAYDWKSTQQYLGPKEWSLFAKWTFREFNELQHHFERRLAPSYPAAEEYLKLFGRNEILVALGRILVFFGGGLGTILVAFAAINDAILLHVKIADWNLLWFAGMSGVVFSIGKGMLPSAEVGIKIPLNINSDIDSALANVAKHTHHYPDKWRGKAWDQSTQSKVSSMFKFKAQLFAMELVSTILAPYILCVALARCSGSICEFILATKADIRGAGEVCGYATFDFDQFQDDAWEGRTLGNEDMVTGSLADSVLRTGNVGEARRQFPRPKALHGKMEKSFFSFKASHPTWVCPQSGQNLVDRVAQYQREATAAFGREQQAHIHAAARQLETLAQFEHQSIDESPVMRIGVNDSHIPRDAEGDNGGTMDRIDHFCAAAEGGSVMPPSMGQHAEDGLHGSSPDEPLQSAQQPGLNHLSTELRRILNMSTLDPDVSILGSFQGAGGTDDNAERRTERQYMWLERYHNHIARQTEEARNASSNS